MWLVSAVLWECNHWSHETNGLCKTGGKTANDVTCRCFITIGVSSLFLDHLDPAKKFRLSQQDTMRGIIEMIVQLYHMFLAYSIMNFEFEQNLNTIFNLPHMNKVISGMKAKIDEKSITTLHYQGISVDNYQCKKWVPSKTIT